MSKSTQSSIRGWLLTILLIAASLAQAAPIASADQVTDEPHLIPRLHYFVDTENDLTLADLLREVAPHQWQLTRPGQTSFGYTAPPYWFRIDLTNVEPEQLNKLLVINVTILDHIEYYLLKDGELVQSTVTGDSYPFAQRLIPHPLFLFPLTLEPQAQYALYLKVHTAGAMEVPVALWNEREFYLRDSATIHVNAMYYGILLFVIVFNLFVYFRLKEATYLCYVLIIATILLIQSTLHARTFEHLWPNIPGLQNMIIGFALPLAVILTSYFVRSFLRVDEHHRGLSVTLKAIGVMGAISFALAFILPFSYSIQLSMIMLIPAILVGSVAGPLLWWKGVMEARYYTIAWLGLQIGATAFVLYKLGVLPAHFITLHGLQIGSAMEAVLLSIAIADRIYRERNDRLQAQSHIIREATERRQIERQLLLQATHSAVTQLPNRALFENKVERLIADHPDQQFLLCLIHLGRFHEIDKTLGHDNADRLLCEVADAFNSFCATLDGVIVLEESDTGRVYRLANTEGVTLALLLRHRGVLKVDERVNQLEEKIKERVEFEHLTLDLGAKIGIAQYPFHARNSSGLIRKAHIALDNSSAGQANVSFYTKELDPYNERRLTLMAELDKAISQDALQLYFQPQMDLASGEIVGVETLLRWVHPEHGFIPPDEFVVLAERTGIITPLTRWVLRQALVARDQLQRAGHALHLSINVSAVNLREPDFARATAELLLQYAVRPQEITLEITETAMMSNALQAQQELSLLSQIGVQLSVDDFGTGYSSLSYIRKLPINEIKIDKSLIFDLTAHSDDQVVVKTTLDMCHNLGYRVVAEGVENQEIQDILTGLGCDVIQGYYLARPMPLPDLLKWLRERSARGQAPEPGAELAG